MELRPFLGPWEPQSRGPRSLSKPMGCQETSVKVGLSGVGSTPPRPPPHPPARLTVSPSPRRASPVRRGVPSCEKSISRNHASFVLHSRFPPFGFVLKPVGLIDMVLGELRRKRVRASPRNYLHRGLTSWEEGPPREKSRFRETMLLLFSIVGFPPSGSY